MYVDCSKKLKKSYLWELIGGRFEPQTRSLRFHLALTNTLLVAMASKTLQIHITSEVLALLQNPTKKAAARPYLHDIIFVWCISIGY